MLNHLRTTFLILLSAYLLSTVNAWGQQGIMNEVIYPSTYGNGQKFGYLEYLPPNYSSNSNKYAVLISLHGLGERSSGTSVDLEKLKVANMVAKLYYWQKRDFPFIVISPQQPNNVTGRYSGRGSWDSNIIDEVLERVKKLRRVDTDRIYITGTSMGGGGVWSYLKAHGDKIAAAAPICGTRTINSTDAASSKVKNTPIWAFHNHDDGVVGVGSTENIFNWIATASPAVKPKKTIFKSGGHNSWDRVYTFLPDNSKYYLCSDHTTSPAYGPNSGKPHIFNWFLTHSRNGSSSEPPANQTPVAKAGSDKTITLPTNKVTLNGGSSSDSDGSIASYKWTKLSGPSTYAFSASGSKSTEVKNLVKGTYTFQLTIKDNDGASDTDDVKVTVKAKPVASVGNGLKYAYYEGDWNTLPDFSKLTPKKTGQVSNFTLSPKQQTGYYAFKFDGFIDIKSSGTYTFYTNSDDGSKLYIDGKQIVNNDGRHGPEEKSGKVSLSAGKHSIRVTYFDKWGNNDVLKTFYKGPNISKMRIPDNVLFLSTEGGSSSGNELSYAYYEGNWSKLPNFGNLSPKKTGSVDNFTLSPRSKDDYYAFKFEGSISISTSGTYTFYTSSDDGSQLYIDGKLVVNNDGLHSARERSGQQYLSAGNHSIKVTFFEKTGGALLNVSYKGPNISKKRIPDSVLGSSNARTETANKGIQESNTLFGDELETETPNIAIYPNPASEYLQIDNAQDAQYTIFDYGGRSVLSGILDRKTDLDVLKLKNGIYFLKLRHKSSLMNRKILIQH